MTKYVLFRDDPNTHKEVYVMEVMQFQPFTTSELRWAIFFDTAREAYEFGEQNDLKWWRVGQR